MILTVAQWRKSDPVAREIERARAHVFAARLDSLFHRLLQRYATAHLDELDEARQVDARQHLDPAALQQREREIARRAAEHVGGDDDAAALVDGFGGGRDLALAALEVVLRPDANGAQMGLRAHHVLHRGDELLRQPAMRDQNDADHVERAPTLSRNRFRSYAATASRIFAGAEGSKAAILSKGSGWDKSHGAL